MKEVQLLHSLLALATLINPGINSIEKFVIFHEVYRPTPSIAKGLVSPDLGKEEVQRGALDSPNRRQEESRPPVTTREHTGKVLQKILLRRKI